MATATAATKPPMIADRDDDDPVETTEPAAEATEAPAAPATPHQFTAEETAEIDSLTAVTDDAERKYLDLAEQAKNAKKYYEAQVDRLRAYIRDCRAPNLFNGGEPEAKPAEDWRKELLSGIIDDSRALKALASADLFTIGDLTDFQSDGKKTIRDIKGVGDAAAKVIEDAMEKFWAGRGLTDKGDKPTDEAPI